MILRPLFQWRPYRGEGILATVVKIYQCSGLPISIIISNTSSRRIFLLCSQGRVPGAEKKGKTWLIPKDAVKPTDPRKKNR